MFIESQMYSWERKESLVPEWGLSLYSSYTLTENYSFVPQSLHPLQSRGKLPVSTILGV